MTVRWVRVDAGWARNPKVLQLTGSKRWRAAVVYIASLGYSGEHNLDGWIPEAALPFIHGTTTDAAHLVEVGLWQELPDVDGWHIHDWDVYQLSGDEVEARSERARAAAQARWGKQPKPRIVEAR